jgi:hypothetical protein
MKDAPSIAALGLFTRYQALQKKGGS